MSDTGTDERATFGEADRGTPLSPAATADRVAMLDDDDATIRGRQLPTCDRLDAPPPRTRLSRLAFAAAWCVTIALLMVAALRILCHDATVPLMWLNAFTLYIYLPAYAVLAIAAWKRHWWLATASVVVVACHLTWVAPDFRPATPYVLPSTSATQAPGQVRIFYANVFGQNHEFGAMINEAIRADADVIVVAELTRPSVKELARSEAIKAYHYGTNLARRHAGDINVYSRLPVNRMQLIVSRNRVCIVVDLVLGNETLRLICVHSPKPLLDGANNYALFWQQMLPIIAEQLEPLVVIGDFNATQHSLVYKQLTSGRLRSAHEDRGRGYAMTWPNGQWPLPPLRIDQALLSPQVECVSIVEGEGPGSDHKPLILDLRVHASEPSEPVR